MIIDARSGVRGVLIDAATGKRIPFARWANLDTGEYEALAATPDGKAKAYPPRLIRGKTALRFLPGAPLRGASPLSEEAKAEEAREFEARHGKALLCPPGFECEERGCHDRALYLTADEQELTPDVMPDGTPCERARATRVHRWCAKHYRLPVMTSRRGVEREVEVAVRPQ